MNAADRARLELARKAFEAARPSDAEVQRGVRQLRLALDRPRRRRHLLSKTLVAVVLAMGGLAYAKPQALGQLLPPSFRTGTSASKRPAPSVLATVRAQAPPHDPRSAARGAAPAVSAEVEPRATTHSGVIAAKVESSGLATAGLEPPPADVTPHSSRSNINRRDESAPSAAPGAPGARGLDGSHSKSRLTQQAPVANSPGGVSEWGRVGSALAQGDEERALVVLSELAASDDPSTRDKADLGRAQLMLSRGNRDQACATARSLMRRQAGSRIERQALALLRDCNR